MSLLHALLRLQFRKNKRFFTQFLANYTAAFVLIRAEAAFFMQKS